jgi:hypothetical protein
MAEEPPVYEREPNRMEEIIGGALLGAFVTSLFPKLSQDMQDGFNSFFHPVAKAAVGGLYTVTSTTMETVAETQESFKDMWEEARAEAEAKRKAASHVKEATKNAAKAVKIEVEAEERKTATAGRK